MSYKFKNNGDIKALKKYPMHAVDKQSNSQTRNTGYIKIYSYSRYCYTMPHSLTSVKINQREHGWPFFKLLAGPSEPY
jgi:hypothetical protein